MSPRKPELEDGEQPQSLVASTDLANQLERAKPELDNAMLAARHTPIDDLTNQLEQTKPELNHALRAATPAPSNKEGRKRLLVVDDNPVFLETFIEAADNFNRRYELDLHVETCQPQTVTDLRERILKAFEEEDKGFDYVLLDFTYTGLDFTGFDVLRTLRTDNNGKHLGERDENEIRMFYMPVAIVTRGSSNTVNNKYFEEEALGAGADKVYTQKGCAVFVETVEVGQDVKLTSGYLIESLLESDYEIRSRAWSRLWRDIREQMEESIKEQLDGNQWVLDKDINHALRVVWDDVAIPLKKAGYATHLSMRLLVQKKDNKQRKWHLEKIGSTDMDSCPVSIPWDAMPLLRDCLVEKNMQIDEKKQLDETDLINPLYTSDSILRLRSYIGRSAMAARIDTKMSPVGTFLVTRISGLPPFFDEDKTQFRMIVERLGLFIRELRMLQRNHRRQLALVNLGRVLLEIDDLATGDFLAEDLIVAKAVSVLHKHLHLWRNGFTENPDINPALLGRVAIRLIEPGTGRLMRPDPSVGKGEEKNNTNHIPLWALGFGTDETPSNISITEPALKSCLSCEEFASNEIEVNPPYKKIIEQEYLQAGENLTDPAETKQLGKGKKNKSGLFFPVATREDIQPSRQDKTKTKMLVAIKAGSVVVGAINVEHQNARFYGAKEETSADFALLQGVAQEVGQALTALRGRRMLRELLKLHTKTAEEKDEDKVIEQIMGIFYYYTGCAVGVWLQPDLAGVWKIENVWECRQGYKQNEPAPKRFSNYHKQPSSPARLEQWRQHVMGEFSKTWVSELVGKKLLGWDTETVFYTEEIMLDDTEMGIKTLSQALLALRDRKTNELLGVFCLLFNQRPGLDIKQQKPLLEDAARFAASYLSIRRQNRQYVMNSQIVQQQTALGLAYQQLRHSLKLQLGGLNGSIDWLLMKLENGDLDKATAEQEAAVIKGFLSYIAKDIDMSKELMDAPTLKPVNLRTIWETVCGKFAKTASLHDIELVAMTDDYWVSADSQIVSMVFWNLLDNAIEAMADSPAPKRITCLPLSTLSAGYRRIAVRDTGPGVAPQITGRLFKDIGLSTKPSGTGFGTYFSAFMLERSGASIEYDRSYQTGAQFILTFPVIVESTGEEA